VLAWGILGSQICVAVASEIWESRYLFAEAVAEVVRSGDTVRGVLFLKEPFREISTYHFTGTINGDVLRAAHHSGHWFVGKLVNDGEITGTLTARTGTQLTITARRRLHQNLDLLKQSKD
jgi:hypothetical protein